MVGVFEDADGSSVLSLPSALSPKQLAAESFPSRTGPSRPVSSTIPTTPHPSIATLAAGATTVNSPHRDSHTSLHPLQHLPPAHRACAPAHSSRVLAEGSIAPEEAAAWFSCCATLRLRRIVWRLFFVAGKVAHCGTRTEYFAVARNSRPEIFVDCDIVKRPC